MANDQMVHHANSPALARGGPMTTYIQARKSESQFTGWEVITPVMAEPSLLLMLNPEPKAQPVIIQKSMGHHLGRSRSTPSARLNSQEARKTCCSSLEGCSWPADRVKSKNFGSKVKAYEAVQLRANPVGGGGLASKIRSKI